MEENLSLHARVADLEDQLRHAQGILREQQQAERSIDDLIARSSFGDPDAVRARAEVAPEMVGRVLARADDLGGDPLHPTGRCTCGGEGSCMWCMSHCVHCGSGLVPARVEDVPWLVKDFDVLYRVAKALVDPAKPDSGTAVRDFAAVQIQLERLRPAFEHIQMVKATLRERG